MPKKRGSITMIESIVKAPSRMNSDRASRSFGEFRSPGVILRVATLLFLYVAATNRGFSQSSGADVAIVYSKQIPGSKTVAEYYAQKRSVPKQNLIEIDVPQGDAISRATYRDQIE